MARADFGKRIRRLRTERKISLRSFAKTIGISPTYLSKVERGEFPPPAEARVKAIAEALMLDSDELLALAGKVASDLPDIIQRRPREMATFLRTARGLSAADIERLTKEAEKLKQSS
jgi:transcriptional regulator with XRE-family HTH domain